MDCVGTFIVYPFCWCLEARQLGCNRIVRRHQVNRIRRSDPKRNARCHLPHINMIQVVLGPRVLVLVGACLLGVLPSRWRPLLRSPRIC